MNTCPDGDTPQVGLDSFSHRIARLQRHYRVMYDHELAVGAILNDPALQSASDGRAVALYEILSLLAMGDETSAPLPSPPARIAMGGIEPTPNDMPLPAATEDTLRAWLIEQEETVALLTQHLREEAHVYGEIADAFHAGRATTLSRIRSDIATVIAL